MALAAVSQDIQTFVQRLGLHAELSLLDRAWESECGAMSAVACLAAVERQTLVVEVTSSSAFHELTLRRRELVRRLNLHFPTPWIRNLSIKMARYGNGR